MQILNLDSDDLYTEIARKLNIAFLMTNDKRLEDAVKNLRRWDLSRNAYELCTLSAK